MTTNIKPLCNLSKLSYLLDKDGYYTTIHIVLEIKGKPISISELKTKCREKLLCYMQFNSYIDFDSLTWNRTQVDLNDHIKQHKLDVTHDSIPVSLEKYISTHISNPLHVNDKPPWNIYSIYHNDPTQNNYILINLSHALGDGQIITAIISSIGDNAELHMKKEKRATSQKQLKPNQLKSNYLTYKEQHTDLLIKQIILIFMFLAHLLFKWKWVVLFGISYIVYCNLYSFKNFFKLITTTKPTCLRAIPEFTSHVKLFAKGKPISVLKLKQIKQKMGFYKEPTINDIMTSLISGAIGKYHTYKNIENIPKQGHVFSLFGLHRKSKNSLDLLQDYASHGKENDMAFCYIPISIDPVLSVTNRLQKTQSIMNQVKNSIDVAVCSIGIKAAQYFPTLIMYLIQYITKSIADACISNVIVPCKNMSLCGRKVVQVYNCTSPFKFGTTFNILSYNDTITVCSASDKNHIPDPHVLLNYIYEEYQELCKLYM